jgi:hypothetical protein
VREYRKGARKGTLFFCFSDFDDDASPQHVAEFYTQPHQNKFGATVLNDWHSFFSYYSHLKRIHMDKTNFYRTVYRLVEDYFNNFSKKPNYLLINSKFDLSKFIDKEDLKQYVDDRFKGMMIVRTPDINEDKIVVY